MSIYADEFFKSITFKPFTSKKSKERNCSKCGESFLATDEAFSKCQKCPKCTGKHKENWQILKESVLKSHKQNTDPYLYAECKICGYRATQIHLHVITHDITGEEYKQKYGTTRSQKLCDAFKGDNNPAYGHGGKYSPFSEKFIKYQDEQDYREGLENVKRASIKTKTENPHKENTKIEYYLAQGMTEEEAKQALSERQSTFSLDKCKEKYGDEDGFEVWRQRQEKWMESLNDRSDDEKEMDMTKRCASYLIRDGVGENTNLYLANINNGLVKIGMAKNIKKRMTAIKDSEVFYCISSTTKECFMLEQLVKRKFGVYRISREFAATINAHWTETFQNIDAQTIKDFIIEVRPNIYTLFESEFPNVL